MNISAKEFWDAYFRNAFVKLQRVPAGYLGVISSEVGNTNLPLIFEEVKQITIAIDDETLAQYHYDMDERFNLLYLRESISHQYKSIITQDFHYITPPPFEPSKMSNLFAKVHKDEGFDLEALNMETLCQIISSRISKRISEQHTSNVALTWFSGELRDSRVGSTLVRIIAQSKLVNFHDPIYADIVNKALSALQKVNAKNQVDELIELLGKASGSGKLMLGQLIGLLLSQDRLMTHAEIGDKIESPAYWEDYLKDINSNWNRFDTNHILWEYRYMAASRMNCTLIKELKKLSSDVVPVVSEASKNRLIECRSRGQPT